VPEPRAPTSAPDPAPLMALSTAHWGAQVLLTANRLGLFGLLADAACGADELAKALSTEPRATRLLLNACVGLGLLAADRDRYGLSPLAAAYLVPGRPGYLGDAFRYSDDLYTAWGRLGEALASGHPVVAAADYTGGEAERTRHFVYGMHNRALGIGGALLSLVDLGERRRLLDVGGGPGTYAALFARRHADLRATVLDLPGVAEIGVEIVAAMGVGDRVHHQSGDYKTTAFPVGHDAVLISGVFHRETEAGCRDLINRAAAALAPGGLLIVSDVFTDAGGAEPVFAALFGLNMLLTADDGGVHADADVVQWCSDAGFTRVQRCSFPPPMPHRVVTGVRS
jgi:3-hydroxy-5-methyl-1-naphthoate 3-O-methyltransferase